MPDNRLGLRIVENPLRPSEGCVLRVEVRPQTSIADLRAIYFPSDLRVDAYLNGVQVQEYLWADTSPKTGDFLVFVPALSGGSSGKNLFRMVLMLAISVAAIATGQVWLGLAGWQLAAFVGGVTLVGGLLVNALLPPATTAATDSSLESQNYSWQPQNTQSQGVVVARWYGQHKIYGNIIASFIENAGEDQYLNALINLGFGPVAGLANFKINDQPASNFSEVTIQTRYGYLNQAVIDNFAQTKVEYSAQVEVKQATPYDYVTIGDDFDALEVDVYFPSGLWSVSSNSSDLQNQSVQLKIEIQKAGGTTWIPLTTHIDETTSASYRFVQYGDAYGQSCWSMGKYVKIRHNTYWWNHALAPEATRYDYSAYQEGAEADSDASTDWRWHWMGSPPAEYRADWDEYNETVAESVEAQQSASAVTITDNTSQPFHRTFSRTIADKGRYTVRTTRVSEDHSSTSIGDTFYFAGVREVINDPFQYPRQALVSVRAKATDQLSGSIQISCVGKMAIVRIWDGLAWTFDWSDNPAWVLYDILTQPVIGGDGSTADPFTILRYDGLDPSRLDLPKFLEWANYCDELVPDGLGGTEKRITFNGGFDYDTSMWEAAIKVAQIGRAVPVWNGSLLTLAIDKPADPVNLYSVGNIEESKFKETFLSLEDRATQIEADFINRDLDYERDRYTIYHPDLPANEYKASLDLFGVTKPSEVWRAGMYRLLCNRYLVRTVEIDVDIEALNATIGDVVEIQHDVPRWGEGGRIVSAAGNTATLDKVVTIEEGQSYRLMLRTAEDAVHALDVTSSAGAHTVITVDASFDLSAEYDEQTAYASGDKACHSGKIYSCIQATAVPSPPPENVSYWAVTDACPLPLRFDVYAFGQLQSVTKPFRIMELSRSQDQKVTLTCIEYREEVYAGETAEPALNDPTQAALKRLEPVNVSLLQSWLKGPYGSREFSISATWTNVTDASLARIDIWFKAASSGNWIKAGTATGESFEIVGVEPGTYTIIFLPVNTSGTRLHYNRATQYGITVRSVRKAEDISYATVAGSANAITSGSSASVSTTGDAFADLSVGDIIYCNGQMRRVIAKTDDNNITLDSPVDWDNGGAGYSFEYDANLSHVYKQITDAQVDIAGGEAALADARADITQAQAEIAQTITELASEVANRAEGDAELKALVDELGVELDDTHAEIVRELIVRSTGDTALAASITALSATVGDHTARISAEQLARANADSALAADITSLQATVGDHTAAISSEAITRASGDSALAASISSLNSTVDGHTATIESLETAIADGDMALAAKIDSLEIDHDDSQAKIVTEQLVRSSAIAPEYDGTKTYSLGATVLHGGSLYRCTTAITVAEAWNPAHWTQVPASLYAQYTMKLDVYGNVIGISMANDGESGQIIMTADTFAILDPNQAADAATYKKAPFIVGNVGGSTLVGINGDLLVDGTIKARMLAAEEIISSSAQIKNGIIGNAHIDNLNASKITAGELSVDRLTANSIITGKIASNAVSAIWEARGSSSYVSSISLTVTLTVGTSVWILGKVGLGADSSSTSNVGFLGLARGSTALDITADVSDGTYFGSLMCLALDAPGAGTFTYTMSCTGALGSFQYPVLQVVELRR